MNRRSSGAAGDPSARVPSRCAPTRRRWPGRQFRQSGLKPTERVTCTGGARSSSAASASTQASAPSTIRCARSAFAASLASDSALAVRCASSTACLPWRSWRAAVAAPRLAAQYPERGRSRRANRGFRDSEAAAGSVRSRPPARVYSSWRTRFSSRRTMRKPHAERNTAPPAAYSPYLLNALAAASPR